MFFKRKVDLPQLENLDLELADLDSYEKDPMEFAREWGGEELSPLFYANFVLSVGKKDIKIPAKIKKAAGGGWDFFKMIATSIEEYKNLLELKYSARRKKEKGARIACHAVMKDFNNVSRLMTVLTLAGVMTGVAGLIIVSSVTFGLAATAWGVAAFSCVRLHRAVKKCKNPSYWLDDILDKYQTNNEKVNLYKEALQKIESKYSNPDERSEKIKNKIIKINNKIHSLEKKSQYLKHKALAIAKVKFSKENPLSEKLKTKSAAIFNIQDMEQLSSKNASPKDKKLVAELEKNQHEIAIARATSTIGLVTLAVGLTLTALAPFTGPAAPAVLAAGLVLVGVGIVIDVGQKVVTSLVNSCAKKHQHKKLKAELINKYEQDGLFSNPELNHMTAEMKFQFHCSFELSKAAFKKDPKNQTISDTELETRWYQSLRSLDEKAKNHLLKVAETKTLDQHILTKTLGVESNDEMLNQISEKDKERIINRQCRSGLSSSLKSRFKSFFHKNVDHHPKEEKEPHYTKQGKLIIT